MQQFEVLEDVPAQQMVWLALEALPVEEVDRSAE